MGEALGREEAPLEPSAASIVTMFTNIQGTLETIAAFLMRQAANPTLAKASQNLWYHQFLHPN